MVVRIALFDIVFADCLRMLRYNISAAVTHAPPPDVLRESAHTRRSVISIQHPVLFRIGLDWIGIEEERIEGRKEGGRLERGTVTKLFTVDCFDFPVKNIGKAEKKREKQQTGRNGKADGDEQVSKHQRRVAYVSQNIQRREEVRHDGHDGTEQQSAIEIELLLQRLPAEGRHEV